MATILNLLHSLQPRHHPQKLPPSQQANSSPTSQRNGKPSERSSQLPTTCFQTYTYLHPFPPPFPFLLKPASFFLLKAKPPSLFCSPFPQESYPINYLLSVLCLLTHHCFSVPLWSFRYVVDLFPDSIWARLCLIISAPLLHYFNVLCFMTHFNI